MSDVFIPIIVSTLEGLGYNVKAQDSPNLKDWDNPPIVLVVPAQKESSFFAMGGIVQTIYRYDCFLVSTADLSSNFDGVAQSFYATCVSNFMVPTSPLLIAGVIMPKVKPKYDYFSGSFPKGWVSTCVQIEVYATI